MASELNAIPAGFETDSENRRGQEKEMSGLQTILDPT